MIVISRCLFLCSCAASLLCSWPHQWFQFYYETLQKLFSQKISFTFWWSPNLDCCTIHTILCGNSLWYQNPDSYPSAICWGPQEIIWVLVQEQYQLSHQVIWSVLSNVCILGQAHYFEQQLINDKMPHVPYLHVNFWVHWVSSPGKC